MTSTPNAAALAGITVLDVAGPLGNYCGKLFSDLGARVILVEPPEGAPTRHVEPRVSGRDDLDSSLTFQYQNTNKESIALDLDSAAGQEVFRKLASQATLVIESEQPGVMARRGLGFADLNKINPSLTLTSITAFGQSGPFAHWLATDLTAMGMGGMMYLAGYPDTAPMVACGEQAVGAANVFAGVASMAAVYDAEACNAGQHVDVSMQECVVLGMENAVQFYDLEGSIRKRNAGTQRLAGTGVFECRDGYIYLMAGGVGSNKFWAVTTDWLISEGVAGAEEFREPRWLDQTFLVTDEAKQLFGRIFTPYARSLTKAELHAKGRERRIPLAPICDTRDISQSPQREHRGYFVEVDDAHGTRLRMPGAPYKLSETPWALRNRAPQLGEHTLDVLAWAGYSRGQQEALRRQGAVR
ncbi:succinyl-CoA--benzylsuccinate CoA-transferase [Achromobacter xylosoxidans]|uniref:CaiB/BaiF CoA transferase family protein n=1 Tax=Achromobacter aegrifaciens TaxID=1287736 RepID=UPI000D4EDD94|nr:CoA transferase [Achromobacter aegrifaciens]MDQ1763096.1 CoA transferase [Achromobacter aegrifaciens]PTN50155.1 succinyl-CoA--benzylsuccinate CoA-transferase [Achromobacter xylosoxidans]